MKPVKFERRREPRAPSAPRLRLRVTATAETLLRGGHPWLFANSVREQNRPGIGGELAVVFDRRDQFLAVGLYDPDSPIRVRMLHAGKPLNLDDHWWRDHLQRALDRRTGLFDAQTNGHRWINGESDGWPGLVLDRYAGVLVLKLYSAIWLPRLADITRLIRDTLTPERLVLRFSRNIEAAALASVAAGVPPAGEPGVPPGGQPPVLFLESGLQFEADVGRGQKTGFFLDQRENRRRVEALARGAEVLNAFSFSGGFSLYAARGGAKSVTDLDISVHALESAQRNFRLNQDQPRVAACRHETIQTDVFAWLEHNASPRFDLVILDPPSLAKRESERAGAIQAYARLAAQGVRCLRPGGILVAASCSAHVTAAEFFESVRSAVRRSGRSFKETATTGHPPDHPATFPEARYLKAVFLIMV